MSQCIRFEVPVKAPSLTNQREHHHARHARTDRQRSATRARWPGYEGGPLLVVRLTRVAPRWLDDDNVRGALKSVRDEVAALLRVDDASPLVRWEYGQERGEDAVRVEVAWGTAPAALLGQVLHQLAAQAEAALRAPAEQMEAPSPTWEPLTVAADASPHPLVVVRPDGAGALRAPRKAPVDIRTLATPNVVNPRRKP